MKHFARMPIITTFVSACIASGACVPQPEDDHRGLEGGKLLDTKNTAKPDEEATTWSALTSDHPGARFVPALYYTPGRTRSVDRVIIHTCEGGYDGCISWFRSTNNPYETSAHYVLRSSDGEVTQMVRESDTAHHISDWNPRSIGIEHEGWAGEGAYWFTDAMYRSSAVLVRGICLRHNIPMDRDHIVGHVEVPGATHWDPGPDWNWDYFMALVRDPSTQPPPPPSDPCGGETYYGRCEGGTLVWCEGGAVKRYDCAAAGRTCALENETIGFNCVAAPPPPAPSDPCGGETYYGRCEGGTLVWCENQTPRRYDCTSVGRTCALQNEVIGFNCL